ncbi:hypothetical protein E0Z10_g5315 [Xylaria hypoxylon]|uniref:NB-ARC domain-containing protein n=1 Tax=Xylaria hypoxylon TaxID=37992 RepID=A0A4Z0YGM3_9PEZI|nr:hypothetical protein E0Z10_g5315 [Xylaria hypoxylon]
MLCTKETVKENGLNIWSLPEAGCSSEVDIIAVQGLGSHPFYTWVKKIPRASTSKVKERSRLWPFPRTRGDGSEEGGQDEVMWLRDLLPSELKNARIATYSYPSDWKNRDIKTTLRQCSEQFLNDLLHSRGHNKERQRPLILIGHSLGGLVIQQALVIAVHGKNYSDICESVTGIIFLGAPFRGSELAVYGEWFAKATGRNTELLGILKKDNSHIYDVSRDFWASYEKRDIVCYYENKDVEYGPWKQPVVDAQSASIQGKRPIYMNTGHSGLNKFDGADDENYMRLLPEIQRMVKDASSAMASMQSTTVSTGSTIQKRRYWVVPFGRNKQFVGRKSILEDLLARIPPSVEENNCQRTAIEGLGGVGKTQIALEAAFQVRDMHPDCSIFWVPALDVTSFENAYRKIGQELEVKGIDEDKADIKLLVREALNNESAGRWLMIIDNADDIELFFSNASLSEYLPSSYKGSILFTTRDHKATIDLSSTSVPIERLERDESHELLEKSLHEYQLQNTEATTKLLNFLEDLPLAIKQASAFMAKEGISTTEYLEFCQSSESDVINLLSEDFKDLHRYQQTPNPVVKTFSISFERISKCDPLAADYLRFISFLSEKDIPLSLLPPAAKLEARKAIGTLKGYGFITEQEERNTYDIHRLVRLSMLNWLTNTGGLQEWATKVFQQLANVFPWSNYANKSIWIGYLPHVQNLTKFLKNATNLATKETLLFKLGISLIHLGRYKEAEDMLRKALKLGGEMQGELDPIKLELVHDLGRVLYQQGRNEEAEKTLREALELRQATGEMSHRTVRNMRDLANTLANQERFKESEIMFGQALELIKEMLGTKRPDNNHLDTRTASVDNNTALVFYEEAEGLYQQAHQTDESLGIGVIFLMHDFAQMIRVQGRNEEAEQIHRQLLPLLRTSLGSDHPLAIHAMVELGRSLYQQGKSKSKEAVELLYQALDLRQKVLGEAHPHTLNTMYHLGIALYKQGDSKEAVKILRQTLDLEQKVLGEAHPHTLYTMYCLGAALYKQDGSKEAVNIFRQTLDLQQKVLGEAHPDTLHTREWVNFILGNENTDTND